MNTVDKLDEKYKVTEYLGQLNQLHKPIDITRPICNNCDGTGIVETVKGSRHCAVCDGKGHMYETHSP